LEQHKLHCRQVDEMVRHVVEATRGVAAAESQASSARPRRGRAGARERQRWLRTSHIRRRSTACPIPEGRSRARPTGVSSSHAAIRRAGTAGARTAPSRRTLQRACHSGGTIPPAAGTPPRSRRTEADSDRRRARTRPVWASASG
jgi:hypothetical protein